MQDILAEILARQAEGYQDIVLTGVHIGAYGHERGESLAALVRAILAQTCFPRLRLSSIEPWDLSPELLRLWEDPRLCRHLHLPLQSGCDATLYRMNRRYTIAHFRAQLDAARAAIPDLAVTTDVIVGFPGEDEAEFSVSAQFVADMHLARVHVFPYSVRPGTLAAEMPDQVPPLVKAERTQRMLVIAHASAQAFQRQYLGRRMDVLWEKHAGTLWTGLTDNYIHVEAHSQEDIRNRILAVRLAEMVPDGVRGEFECVISSTEEPGFASGT
jgi:threonylcarbamoyladenosine tRNA methylthiotransferase MtaB